MTTDIGPFRFDFQDEAAHGPILKTMIALGRRDAVEEWEQKVAKPRRDEAALDTMTRVRLLALRKQLDAADQRNIASEGTGGRIDFDVPPTFIDYRDMPDKHKLISVHAHLIRTRSRIRMHGPSIAAFAAGRVGHAFCGLVNIFHPSPEAPDNSPKIYLFPTNPMAGHIEYKSRPHDAGTQTLVYQLRHYGAMVHHDPVQLDIDPMLAMTHVRLRKMLEDSLNKYGDFKKESWGGTPQERAVHSIGFTVIKVGKGQHRFVWRSASQNARTFNVPDTIGHRKRIDIRTPPREWAQAIVQAIDRHCG
jgi:hypothetical protein